MTDQEFIDLATASINLTVDIPFLGEATEEELIRSMLEFLVPLIPVNVRVLLLDASDGLTEEEIERHALLIGTAASQLLLARVPLFIRAFIAPQVLDLMVSAIEQILGFARVSYSLAAPPA